MSPIAAGEPSSFNQGGTVVPISAAALGNFPVNGQGSRFVEDLAAASPAAAGAGITIIETPSPRPAGRQSSRSRPPSPYILRPPTPMGTSREKPDAKSWRAMDMGLLEASRACRGWLQAFGNLRREYESVFAALFGGKLRERRLSLFSFKYRRFVGTIAAVERILDSLASLLLAADYYDHEALVELIDAFAAWIVEADSCFNAMTRDNSPLDLADSQDCAGRKILMVGMAPELARLTLQLSTRAQKPLRRFRALVKSYT
ncbi:hypothetical protein AYL99_09996 [Fonsecaea erecta]|uniref:Uncharacterized protein n=1 Tax=Fonsecaea erecta TaxID=1367422 RepID=A0A178Z7S7_9EURO|nr:hypothetical protein AYL99_09996 [Fonsecaea erecta]OAP55844.1 hypothetical protein AYL99_09996 [Fonsecaea erecta]